MLGYCVSRGETLGSPEGGREVTPAKLPFLDSPIPHLRSVKRYQHSIRSAPLLSTGRRNRQSHPLAD